jgi:hypothetical protein
MVLRRFRDRARAGQPGRDHGISRATAYRYADQGTGVRAARAPDLHEAPERVREEGTPLVILDGKLFSTGRLSEQVTSVQGEAIDAWYSGQHHRPGGNVQAVIRPGSLPLWASPAEPGHVRDITAARVHALPALNRAAAPGIPARACSGREGAGAGIHVPVKSPGGNQEPAPGNQARNFLPRGLLPGRTRVRPAHPALGPPPAHHRPPPPAHPERPRRPHPHPIRAQIHQVKIAEITSVNPIATPLLRARPGTCRRPPRGWPAGNRSLLLPLDACRR